MSNYSLINRYLIKNKNDLNSGVVELPIYYCNQKYINTPYDNLNYTKIITHFVSSTSKLEMH